jgi:hypothetical protein
MNTGGMEEKEEQVEVERGVPCRGGGILDVGGIGGVM